MADWDQVQLLDAQASATAGGVTSVEIPAGVENLNAVVTQSGTASAIVLQGSLDDAKWVQIMKVQDSATLHAITVPPRFLRAVTSATADSHVTVTLQYQK